MALRIAYVCSDLGIPYLGSKAGALHMRQTVRALRELGNDLMVYATTSDKITPNRSENDDILISIDPASSMLQEHTLLLTGELLPQSSLHKDLRSLSFNRFFQEQLLQRIHRSSPELIYERYSLWGFGGLKVAKDLGIPHILEVNAPLCQETDKRRTLNLPDLALAIERHVIEGTNGLVCVSQKLVQHIKSEFAVTVPMEVIPAGVDNDFFNQEISSNSIRKRLNLSEKLVIGFVGSMKPWHRLDVLVEAFSIVRRKIENSCLLLLGEKTTNGGSGVIDIHNVASDNIIHAGQVDYLSIPAHVAAMDICVLPGSNWYGMPMKVFEYMAMGKPIIAPRLDTVMEILDDNVNARLVDEGNVDQMARAIISLVESPKDRERLGQQARHDAVTKHTANERANVLMKFTEMVLRSR